MRKKISLAYVDFWTKWNPEECIFTRALREIADVKIVKDFRKAEYVIFSVFGDGKLDIPSDAVTIMYTGENICPDFNLCDYAFGFEYLEFCDRYLRFPVYLVDFEDSVRAAEKKHIAAKSINIERDKPGFCSFVVSNGAANPIRKQMFDMLSKYKQVSSGGLYLNNMGGPVANKREFEARHKFCLAFENSTHIGYTTEKIVDAFAAGSVPIYWGDPLISEVFNPAAFINVHDYASLEEVCERIKQLDNDDEAYLEMLRQPAFLDSEFGFDNQYDILIEFFAQMLLQPHDKAYRRNREFWGENYVRILRERRDRSARAGLKNALKAKLWGGGGRALFKPKSPN